MNIIKKATLGTALAASAIVSASPAMAREPYYRSHDNTAAVAIGAGIIGLALGAIVAGSHDDRRYYERRGYGYDPAYTSGWVYRDGYYWDHDGRRFSRDDWNRYNRYDNRNDFARRGYEGRNYEGRGYEPLGHP